VDQQEDRRSNNDPFPRKICHDQATYIFGINRFIYIYSHIINKLFQIHESDNKRVNGSKNHCTPLYCMNGYHKQKLQTKIKKKKKKKKNQQNNERGHTISIYTYECEQQSVN
jgi:hypothetical protein